MGINFRKRVKLNKYTNLNIGKTGAGLSFGIPGARISRNAKGKTQVSLGLPGTGLSYTKVLGTKSNKKKNQKAIANQDDAMTYETYQEALYALSHIHTEAADFIDFGATPIRYQTREIGPHQKAALQEIEDYKPNFLDNILNRDEAKLDKLNEKLMDAIEQDQQEREWHHVDSSLQERLLNHDPDAYRTFLEMTDGFEVFADDCDSYHLEFDLNVDEVDDILITVYTDLNENVLSQNVTLNKSGSLSVKELSMSAFNERTFAYVTSLTLGFVKEALALLPVNAVHINVIDDSTNPNTGLKSKRNIVAAEFSRELISQYNFDQINPIDVFQKGIVDVEFGQRKGWGEVEPIEID